MTDSGSVLSLLVLVWIGYFLIHSLLASHRIKYYILSQHPGFTSCYRLAYNIVAVVTLIPVVLIHALYDSRPIFQWPGLLSELSLSLIVFATLGFIWSLKYYDLQAFTGINTCLNRNSATPKDRLTISPLHRFVRHPWYLFALIIIWSREQSQMELISSTMVTIYFWLFGKISG